MVKMRKERTLRERGITLIALIITIVILLIIAGITMVAILGENGLINRAIEARKKESEAEVIEKVNLMLQDYQVEKIDNEELKLIDYLDRKKIEGEIDTVLENSEGNIEVIINNYSVTININGLNIVAIQEIDSTNYVIATYEITGYNKEEELIEILITFKSDTDIKSVIYPDKQTKIYSNGKKEISIDYEVIDGEQYNFIVETSGKKEKYVIQTKGTTVGNKINSGEELQEVAKLVSIGCSYENKILTLGNDIDLECNNDSQWMPIGTISNPFKGVLDGKDYSIKNIYINTTSNYQGLFGVVENGDIKNLNVTGNIANSGNYVGGLVAYGKNVTITKCSLEMDITSSAGIVGGVIGYVTGSSNITQCVNFGDIVGNSRVGGIAGETQYLSNSSITECANYGKVKATSYWLDGGRQFSAAGGIVANSWPNSILNISYCYNSGEISAPGGFVGGILGFTQSNYGGTYISYSYSYGSVSGGNRTGAILGCHYDGDAGVSNCYYLNGVASVSSGSLTSFGTGTDNNTLKSLVDMDVWSNYFVSDSITTPINMGYPIFKWQVK